MKMNEKEAKKYLDKKIPYQLKALAELVDIEDFDTRKMAKDRIVIAIDAMMTKITGSRDIAVNPLYEYPKQDKKSIRRKWL